MVRAARGFTLIEILVVVVILGILSAIVVPQFANASDEATVEATRSQLVKIRNAISVYYVRNGNTLPSVVAGAGTWGELVPSPDYLREEPRNLWVGEPNADVVVLGNAPDAAYQTTHGWIFDQNTGEVWAGGFDANDRPLPRP